MLVMSCYRLETAVTGSKSAGSVDSTRHIEMRVYSLIRTVPFVIGTVVFVLLSPLLFALVLLMELRTEARFRSAYGSHWQMEFESVHGSLAKAHTKVALCAIGIVVIPALIIFVYRQVRGTRHSSSHHRSHRGRLRSGKPLFGQVCSEAILDWISPAAHLWSGWVGGRSMSPYGFFAALRFLFFLGVMVLAALVGFAGFIGSELWTERRYRVAYGAG